MRQRCTNPNTPHYSRYGGRGITVCAEWKSFVAFRIDMEPTHRPGLSLDRINNEGNYCKENCRWATKSEQAKNRCDNVWVDTPNGRMVVFDAAKIAGVDFRTMRARITRGVTGAALFAPGRSHPTAVSGC